MRLQFSGMPRSGSTWLWQVLKHIHDRRGGLRLVSPHNHNEYGHFLVNPDTFEPWPILGIYRDLRDVVTSAYWLNTRRRELGKPTHEWIDKITEGRTPAEGIRAMVDDEEHALVERYDSWYQSFYGKPNVELVRFERATTERLCVYDAITKLGLEVDRVVYDMALYANRREVLQSRNPEHYTFGRSIWRDHMDQATADLVRKKGAFFYDRTGY